MTELQVGVSTGERLLFIRIFGNLFEWMSSVINRGYDERGRGERGSGGRQSDLY
jgi:hypothetical protein